MRHLSKFLFSAVLALGTPVQARQADTAARAAPVDTDRTVLARTTVDYIFPQGTYARIMDKTLDTVLASVMQTTAAIPARDLAKLSGLPADDLNALGEATLAQVMEIVDPAYQKRMDLSMRAIMTEMTGLMTQFEPEIRDGLANAYARRFDETQLRELNAFFATPTGSTYAAESMIIFMDPEVMARMQAFMPVMMKQMPQTMEKVQTAVADLPPPRKYSDLGKAEKAKLAELLGTTTKDLERGGD